MIDIILIYHATRMIIGIYVFFFTKQLGKEKKRTIFIQVTMNTKSVWFTIAKKNA